jgi:peptide/nickel transport system permease protein
MEADLKPSPGLEYSGPGSIISFVIKIRNLRLPWVAIAILALLFVCAIFAPLLSPHDPESLNIKDKRIPPFETWSHPLGTDVLGRDMLSRLIYGARTTVKISLISLGIGAFAGTLIGMLSGYKGGWIDAFSMRVADAALGFPTILIALIVVVIFEPGIYSIILAILLTVWARFARMIRGDVLLVKSLDFVTLAQITGVSTPVIIWRHIFPNVINTLMVITSLLIGQIILLEAALSFLGLGLTPGMPAWGIMVSEGREVILDVWWLSLFPGIAITIVVMAFNFFGDWLRDVLDPKLRSSM